MPRVHSQTARKDYPDVGVKKGDVYFRWSLRPGGPGARGTLYRSATYPKPWQLTSSPFLQTQYQIEHRLSELTEETGTDDTRDEIVGEIRELGDTAQESLDKMPESLQAGPTGEMLQERVDNCESWASELEGVDFPSFEELEEPDAPEDEDDDDQMQQYEDELQAWEEQEGEIARVLEELQNCAYPG